MCVLLPPSTVEPLAELSLILILSTEIIMFSLEICDVFFDGNNVQI